MKNNQKIILILIIPILIFTSFIAVFISSNINDEDEKVNTSNKPIINKQISRLDDFDEFYAVQNAINAIFSNIENPSELLKYFDNDYVISNNFKNKRK